MHHKILSLDTILTNIDQFKKEGKRIVLCHGFFSYLHIGHIRYLSKAKNYGDIVIVSIVADKSINEREVYRFDEKSRAETVASLSWVDMVLINPFNDAYELIKCIKPHTFVRGFEGEEGFTEQEKNSVQVDSLMDSLGIEIAIIQDDDFTSTTLINQYLAHMSEEVQKYLQVFIQRYSIDVLLHTIEGMRNLKVLVIGDTILDEYHYCSAIGKASKDPTLVLKYESHDLFAGGVLAVANHVAGFADSVDLITILGENDSYENFVRSKLRENIRPIFFFRSDAPTIIKRRFLDGYSMNKLFEVYVMDDSALDEGQDRDIWRLVQSKLSEYDLVIAADFGHGAINMKLKRLLSKEARYLAVNAQSNAGNRGFNNITKYPKADYVSIAEHEIRLEMRDLTGKIRPLMNKLARKMNIRKLAVTRGRSGCMVLDLDNEGAFVQVPSFAEKIVDRVGAGDAFFAVTSLAAINGASCEIIGFLGNVVGARAVEIMGNQKYIENHMVTEYIHRLFTGLGSAGVQ